MTALLAWAFLFTVPGLLLGSTGVARRGVVSLIGPIAILLLSILWIVGGGQAGVTTFDNWLPFVPNGAFSLRVDPLSVYMLAILGIVALCVYVYSLSYMAHDPGIRRFFAFLDIFVAAMALLVLAGNLVTLIIGWT